MADLQTSITTISEDQLNAIFGDEPTKHITEDDVVLGKSPVKVEGKSKEQIFQTKTPGSDIPFVNLDDLEDGDENAKPAENKTEETEEEKEAARILAESTKKEKKTKKEEAKPAPASNEVLETLRNTAKFLIEKGQWRDFENSDEILSTLDEAGYEELALKQHEAILEDGYKEKVDRTGDYGKAIFEYIDNGGNPDEVIDLFKEQKAVEQIAIDSEDGQKQLIQKFYTEVYDWSPEKAKKYINTLISNDELESEAQEVDGKYKDFFKQEVENLQLQQKALEQQKKDSQKQFAQTINTKLAERSDFTDKEKKLIVDSVFKYDSALPDGTKVNKFYLKFAEMQKNPDDYLDLVSFVMNKQAYNEKVKVKDSNAKVEKKWSWIKSNSAVDKTKGTAYEDSNNLSPKSKLDFSSILNK